MITALYASLLMLFIIWLTFQVIKQRRSERIAYADGGVEGLQIARSAHGNSIETVPMTLILMAMLEFNGGHIYAIHLCGLLLLVGRYIHGTSILKQKLPGRKLGMLLTLVSQLLLVVLNLIHLPYDKLLA